MKSKHIYFFAEASDSLPLFTKIELLESIHYFQNGMFDIKEPKEYSSIIDAINFGYVSNGDWNQIDSYLLLPKDTDVLVRYVPQKNGGTKYAIDQMMNHTSLVIKVGGVLEKGTMIAGSIGTTIENDFSLKLFKMFLSAIRKDFTKIGDFYVGKNALNKLNLQWRLVTNDKSPKEYDLKLS